MFNKVGGEVAGPDDWAKNAHCFTGSQEINLNTIGNGSLMSLLHLHRRSHDVTLYVYDNTLQFVTLERMMDTV